MIRRALKSNDYLYAFAIRCYQWFAKNNVFVMLRNKREFYNYIKELRDNNSEAYIFSLLEPEHGNLGDIALAYAHKCFLSDYFPEYPIVDINAREYNHYKKYLRRLIKPNDIIVLVGGGSIGDQYVEHERCRREIIEYFVDNRIVSFPQSMYFSNTNKGRKELEKSKKAYSSNNNLILVARDNISYQMMKEEFPSSKILLTPDIVLYLEKTHPKRERRGATLFLRDDVEGILKPQDKELIYNIVSQYYGKVSFDDTQIQRRVPRHMVEAELEEKFDSFRASELVITDRLHGMIFSAITSTPCIVLSNYNHKIKAQYEWIKHLPFIKFCENLELLEGQIEKLKGVHTWTEYSNKFAIRSYRKIERALRH